MQFLLANDLVWLEKLERFVVFKDDCIKMLFDETLDLNWCLGFK